MRNRLVIFLVCLLVILFIADVCFGSVYITPKEIYDSLFLSSDSANEFIITQLRMPRAVMAIIAGAGLSLAGLLMQTLFRNPLAGPFVLGISSGAGLGVALLVMGSALLGLGVLSGASLVIASMIGSIAVLTLIIIMATRIKDTMGLLIVGLMVGSLSGAVVGILAYFSTSQQLQRYIYWSLGSLGNLSWTEIGVVCFLFFISIIGIIFIIKPLNALLLGEKYALSLGINIKRTRWIIIIITSILAGSITAYAGPIAFVGLAVPHLSRLLLPNINHKRLIPVVLLLGSCLLLLCDIIAQIPFSNYMLPINAVTSLFGAPVVIWLILRKRNLHF